jgi:tetratricopeptide (TPR) repeat protein
MLFTKRTADAVRDLTSAVELQPRSDFYRLRGKAYLDLNDAEHSLADYLQAVKLMPESPTAYYDLGAASFHFAKYGEAIEQLDVALRLDPKLASAYMTRAMAKLGLGRNEGIIKEDVERAKQLDKTYENADVARRRTRHLIFYNDTSETIELSFYFQAPAIDENIYWYPGEPASTKPIVWKLDPHSTNRLLFKTKSVDAMQFIYTAKSLDSATVWNANKDTPVNIVPEKEYISWRTEPFTYRLYIKPPTAK